MVQNTDKFSSKVDLAQTFAKLVETDARFELPVPAVMGLVCFRLNGSNAINEKLNSKINDAGRIHITPSKIRDKYILRFAVCSRFTVESDVDLAWAEVLRQVEEMSTNNSDSS